MISCVLSFTSTHKQDSLDVKIPAFLKDNSRTGCNTQYPKTLHKSTLCRARDKISWMAFESIFYETRTLAIDLMGNKKHYLWKNKSIYAIDGSKCCVPATKELRKEFEPNSGLDKFGKGHYPQALVMTVTDVLRQIPIARKISPCDVSERKIAMESIELVPENGIILFDRGFPSYEFFSHLINHYKGHFLIRCPFKNSFKEIDQLTNKSEAVLTMKGITLRAICLTSPDGTRSVLFTNLLDKNKYSCASIRNLYYKRWQIESHYRDEKYSLDLEHFHSKSINGIKQELFASLIMMIITRVLMDNQTTDIQRPPQFKHAIHTLAKEAYLLVTNKPKIALQLFIELLEEIKRIKYYKPLKKRKSYPRMSKTAENKWRKYRNHEK